MINNQSVDLEQVQEQDASTPRSSVPYSIRPNNPGIVGSLYPSPRPNFSAPVQQDAALQNSHQNPVRSYGNKQHGSKINDLTNENRGRNRPPFHRLDHSIRGPANKRTSLEPSEHMRRGTIDSVMKAYASITKLSGSFNEDFEAVLEQYGTLSSLCDLSDADMAKAFRVILTGAAFCLYPR